MFLIRDFACRSIEQRVDVVLRGVADVAFELGAIEQLLVLRAGVDDRLRVGLDGVDAAPDLHHHVDVTLDELHRVHDLVDALTGEILEAAESIDNAATALSKVTSPDQQKLLSEEIQERVVSIFEACNFQDLTGQRIKKVMNTMKFIENHITVMMDIWGGVDAIKAHTPAIVDTREGDEKLLNGPKLEGDVGHASQDDIDALFD